MIVCDVDSDYTNGAKTVYYKVTGGTYYNDKTGSATVLISKSIFSPKLEMTIPSEKAIYKAGDRRS